MSCCKMVIHVLKFGSKGHGCTLHCHISPENVFKWPSYKLLVWILTNYFPVLDAMQKNRWHSGRGQKLFLISFETGDGTKRPSWIMWRPPTTTVIVLNKSSRFDLFYHIRHYWCYSCIEHLLIMVSALNSWFLQTFINFNDNDRFVHI